MKAMRTKDISSSPSPKIDAMRQKHSRIVWCATVSHEFHNGHSVFDGDRRRSILCSNFAVTLLHRSMWVTLTVSSRWGILDILCHGYRACDGWWKGLRRETFVLYRILRLHNPLSSLFNRSSPDMAGYLSHILKIELDFSCNIIFMTWNGLRGLWVQRVGMLTDILLS